jgi:hypothetical protein
MNKIKSFNRFLLEQDEQGEKVPFGFEEEGTSSEPGTSTSTQTSTDPWTAIDLRDELNSQYSKTNPSYKKFIGDLISFVEQSELEGKFSKFTKNPNRFKYSYTKRRTGEAKVLEFTQEEFNRYWRVMQEYVKIEELAEKFENID